jgi:hypothetical protein
MAAMTAIALAVVPASARAADPAAWVETGHSTIPIEYYQGVTTDPQGNHYFDGMTVGLYRTTPSLQETARNGNVIPATVSRTERYNHIGDITWDNAEGGRILLPLECYYPTREDGPNICGNGAIGVADPSTVQWRYYVKLDPADIPKAMWAEVSPDGQLLWTSSGPDLLAYRTADVSPANAGPSGPLIRPVRRLIGAVPPSGITGGTFYGGRLFLAGQDNGPFSVWSVDVDTGTRRLEIQHDIRGESEGLDTFVGLGGVLHWQIEPYSFPGPPTYGSDGGALVHFVPANHPPDCSNVAPDKSTLFPPNHSWTLVTLAGGSDPDGDAITVAVTGVSQDEPPEGGRAGASADARLAATSGQLYLRNERRGGGDGRVYRISFTVSDGKGGSCTGMTAVTVPHDRASSAIDSAPPAYDSLLH